MELVGFAKTKTIKPGDSETVNITVNERDLATYDSYNARTYILEDGRYYLTVAKDAHAAVNNVLAAKEKTTEDGMTAAGSKNMVYSELKQYNDELYSHSAVNTDVEICAYHKQRKPRHAIRRKDRYDKGGRNGNVYF